MSDGIINRGSSGNGGILIESERSGRDGNGRKTTHIVLLWGRKKKEEKKEKNAL